MCYLVQNMPDLSKIKTYLYGNMPSKAWVTVGGQFKAKPFESSEL